MNTKDKVDISKDIWVLSRKLKGLAELFGNCSGDPPFSEWALLGISQILHQYAEEMESLRCALDEGLCERAPTAEQGVRD